MLDYNPFATRSSAHITFALTTLAYHKNPIRKDSSDINNNKNYLQYQAAILATDHEEPNDSFPKNK